MKGLVIAYLVLFLSALGEAGPCNPNPCKNGGECSVKWTYYFTCTCPKEFDGTRCEKEKDMAEISKETLLLNWLRGELQVELDDH
ncbi:EGF-like repeat and discoidin I-like domain-containing protein 3 [Amphiura filiformis]|uniref:EGF-like repeat and discoidin I-like domain-containing protein 3 n=1 Tax=Amphiura filiformis TaxID=82378 RepID=UPI003B20FAEA